MLQTRPIRCNVGEFCIHCLAPTVSHERQEERRKNPHDLRISVFLWRTHFSRTAVFCKNTLICSNRSMPFCNKKPIVNYGGFVYQKLLGWILWQSFLFFRVHNSLSFVCQRSKKRQDKSNKPRPSKRDTSLICCALLLHIAWKRSFAPAKNGKKVRGANLLIFLDYDLFPHPVCKIFFLAKKSQNWKIKQRDC